jgi:hypothetical protein
MLESKPIGRGTEEKRLVFVSCGQFLPREKAIGRKIADIITQETDAHGYFAENQGSLATLTEHVLRALNDCIGFVAIMHERGSGTLGVSAFQRASVWIEQEIAIAAFLVQVLGHEIPVQMYIHKGIELAGIRDKLIANPYVFEDENEIERHFRGIVKTKFSNAVSASEAEPASEEDPITSSPLGQKPHPAVWLTPLENPPDHIVGLQIRPRGYSRKPYVLDADDETAIEDAEILSRGDDLHYALHSSTDGDSVLLASAELEANRPDNSRQKPLQQVQVDSDGDITIRFMQNDSPPMSQLLTVLGTAYVLVNELYPRLRLQPAARMTTMIRTDTRREGPGLPLPGYSSRPIDVDFRIQDFAAAFEDILVLTLRDAKQKIGRAEARVILQSFAVSSMHYQPSKP